MDGSNINLVWYILGGIALFFVLIGFIADKSGLAKKTFSKGTTTKKKDSSEEIHEESVLEEPAVNPVLPTEEPIVEPQGVSKEVSTVSENDFLNDYLPDDSESLPQSGDQNLDSTVPEQNNLYLNDGEQTEHQSLENLEKAYLEVEDTADEVTSKVEDSSVWEVDASSNLEQEDTFNVAAEDAEDEWGMNVDDEEDDSDNFDDVQLPDLDGLNTEEDVWKF